MALPDFLLDPCSALLVFYLISRSLDWHVQQITFRQKNFKRFEDFRRRFWQYSRAYVGFDRVNHSNSIFITTENHHVGEIFTLAPVFFSLAAQCSHFLHSRIATGHAPSCPLCIAQGSALSPWSRAKIELCKVRRAALIFHFWIKMLKFESVNSRF